MAAAAAGVLEWTLFVEPRIACDDTEKDVLFGDKGGEKCR
jgi:hypothetical protein